MAIDWDEARDEVVGHLQALIRINTVNPPSNETAAAHLPMPTTSALVWTIWSSPRAACTIS